MAIRETHGQTPRRVGDAGTAGHSEPEWIEGIVKRTRIDAHGNEIALHVVIESDAGSASAVYMRGREVRGIVAEGDRVALTPARTVDGTIHATHLKNLTTNSAVHVWNPPLKERVKGAATPVLISGVLGPAVGVTVASLLNGSHSSAPPVSGRPSDSGGLSVGLVVVIALVVAMCAFYALYIRPRRRSRTVLIAAANAGS
jgi:hypothetical protein